MNELKQIRTLVLLFFGAAFAYGALDAAHAPSLLKALVFFPLALFLFIHLTKEIRS